MLDKDVTRAPFRGHKKQDHTKLGLFTGREYLRWIFCGTRNHNDSDAWTRGETTAYSALVDDACLATRRR